MSFRGRGTDRGGRGGGRGGFSRGGAGRGGSSSFQTGPPDQVFEMGTFIHKSESDILCKSTNVKIPYFNAPIYLQNKSQVGKVDEILGPINDVYFTVKLQEGVLPTSFAAQDKLYIAGDKLLPLDRFLPKPAPAGGKAGKPTGKQGMGGAGRGGRGGGRGASRGGARGGFGRGAPRGGGFGRGAPRGGRGGPRGASRGRGRPY